MSLTNTVNECTREFTINLGNKMNGAVCVAACYKQAALTSSVEVRRAYQYECWDYVSKASWLKGCRAALISTG